jgi:hypothetical protein
MKRKRRASRSTSMNHLFIAASSAVWRKQSLEDFLAAAAAAYNEAFADAEAAK